MLTSEDDVELHVYASGLDDHGDRQPRQARTVRRPSANTWPVTARRGPGAVRTGSV